MPFYELAENCPDYFLNAICPVASCRKSITQKQSIFACCVCNKLYHPSCKGIIGAAKTKKAAESNWVCSADCSNTLTFTAVTTPTDSPKNIPSESGRNSESEITCMRKQLDEQFKEIKSLINDIRKSQEFICNEFDLLKTEYKKIAADNILLIEKCENLQLVCQNQDERINSLELNLDTINQRGLDSNLIIGGLPNKSCDPNTIFSRVCQVLECDDVLGDVIYCDYLTSRTNYRNSSNEPEEVKLIIKFKNHETKKRVVHLKKKKKHMFFASDIGFPQYNNRKLFFRDHLTSFRLSLYREARQIKLSHNYKYLWVSDGNILFRKTEGSKVIRIQSKADLITKITGVSNKETHNQSVSTI